ncbi:MAG TPA: hypothetical protein VFB12_19530 [Ktedonobacteraceae bacterium]|nr:hypothetical protein [Ktedonobacteraceae bacterium]
MKKPIYLLWLEDVQPSSLSTVPSLVELARRGIDLHLTPLPLVEKGQCYYQAMTGMGPGKFGRFDAVQPEMYCAQVLSGIPEGGRLLPDILRKHKLAVTSLEITATDALDILTSAAEAPDLALVRFTAVLAPNELDALVQHCLAIIGSEAHLFVLTGVSSPSPRTLVNVNDFLADEGLLEVRQPRSRATIIWSETLAYGLGTGQIWVNLRGREPQGIVNSGREYQEVCNVLIRELRTNWLDSVTYEPVVEQVFKKDEIYTGEYLFKAPDLTVVYRPGYAASPNATNLDLDGESILSAQQTDHVAVASDPGQSQAPYARLIAGGPSLVSDFSGQAELIDIMPSIMYLLGLPIPQHVDGQVIEAIFTQSYRLQTPIRRSEVDEGLLSDEEEGLIVNRLRDLGYL